MRSENAVMLTARNVPTLAPGVGKEAIYRDLALPGFYLAVSPASPRSPKGVRAYGVWYRVAGHPRQKRLGRHPVVGLAEARERARAILEAARVHGSDLAAAPRADTLAAVVEAFITFSRQQKPRKRSDRTLDGYQELVDGHIKPSSAGKMRVEVLDPRRDLGGMIDDIARETPATAVNTYRLVHAATAWAFKEGRIDRDPSVRVDKPESGDSKERALRDDEIAILWRAAREEADAVNTSPTPGHGVRKRTEKERADAIQRACLARLILLTGARPGEAALFEWKELEEGARLWHIPAEHRKGQRMKRRPHIFPLSDLALEVFEELRAVTGDDRRGFPWTRESKYEPHWIDPLYRVAKRLGLVDHWTPHDLRRTCGTGLGNLGYDRDEISFVIGHTPQGGGAATGVYDRARRMPERRKALDDWGRHVAEVIGRKSKPARKGARRGGLRVVR